MSQSTTGSVGLPGIIRNGQEANNPVITSGKMFSNATMTRQMQSGYSNDPSSVSSIIN